MTTQGQMMEKLQTGNGGISLRRLSAVLVEMEERLPKSVDEELREASHLIKSYLNKYSEDPYLTALDDVRDGLPPVLTTDYQVTTLLDLLRKKHKE